MEFLKSLVKYDEKTGRLKYLYNVLALIAINIVVGVLCGAIMGNGKVVDASQLAKFAPQILVCGVFGLCMLYLGFVTTAKRVWDLTADKTNALWYTAGFYVACLIPIVNFIAGLVAFVFLFFIKGKEEV